MPGFALMTSSGVIPQGKANPGDYNLPKRSLLSGDVTGHETGMADLALDECNHTITFSPLDYENFQGNMVLWDDEKGGRYPWDVGYYNPEYAKSSFDPEYITRHAPDSAATATTFAAGIKTATHMVGVDLYEQPVTTILEEALDCGKAAGVVTSVPILHATPAAFLTHGNNRNDRNQVRSNFYKTAPSFVSGICTSNFYPDPNEIDLLCSNKWAFLRQHPNITAQQFYSSIQDLNPDNGDHIVACFGGDYSLSRQFYLPLRGVDGNYRDRWCSRGSKIKNPTTNIPVRVLAATPNDLCNFYNTDELNQIPHVSEMVAESLKFLSKDVDGFFLLVEQGDVS